MREHFYNYIYRGDVFLTLSPAQERKMGPADFRKCFKSITVDNGSEFQDCAGMEKSVRNRTPRTWELPGLILWISPAQRKRHFPQS